MDLKITEEYLRLPSDYIEYKELIKDSMYLIGEKREKFVYEGNGIFSRMKLGSIASVRYTDLRRSKVPLEKPKVYIAERGGQPYYPPKRYTADPFLNNIPSYELANTWGSKMMEELLKKLIKNG